MAMVTGDNRKIWHLAKDIRVNGELIKQSK